MPNRNPPPLFLTLEPRLLPKLPPRLPVPDLKALPGIPSWGSSLMLPPPPPEALLRLRSTLISGIDCGGDERLDEAAKVVEEYRGRGVDDVDGINVCFENSVEFPGSEGMAFNRSPLPRRPCPWQCVYVLRVSKSRMYRCCSETFRS